MVLFQRNHLVREWLFPIRINSVRFKTKPSSNKVEGIVLYKEKPSTEK